MIENHGRDAQGTNTMFHDHEPMERPVIDMHDARNMHKATGNL